MRERLFHLAAEACLRPLATPLLVGGPMFLRLSAIEWRNGAVFGGSSPKGPDDSSPVEVQFVREFVPWIEQNGWAHQ